MKTRYFIKLMLMVVFTPIIFVSCSKNESGPVNTTASSQQSFHDGAIYDKGFSESGMKQMQVVLSNQNYNFYNAKGNASLNDTIISVVFYSDQDGMVPSGIYSYSESPDAGPYTFGSASLYLQSADYSGSLPISSITGGSIKVLNSDSHYEITFQCVVSTGHVLRSQFKGGMSYFDIEQ
jgi:hypothetical protein